MISTARSRRESGRPRLLPAVGRARRPLRRTAVAAAIAVAAGIGLAQPAAADVPGLPQCLGYLNAPTGHPARVTAQLIVPGGRRTGWSSPAGVVAGDGLRFTAGWFTRTDNWGSRKFPSGDNDIAPNGWPLPGARKYALIGRALGGAVWVNGREHNGSEWFPIGDDSGCLQALASQTSFEFEINDDNLGDNGDGPNVVIQQWW